MPQDVVAKRQVDVSPPTVDAVSLAKMLGEKYVHIRHIGQGSFGTASLVRDAEGRERVVKAVRICSVSRKRQEEAVNEVNLLASLKHPFIVRYHESFISSGILGILMDYAAGGDLHHRIRKARRECQRFSEEQILRWFSQALLGLKYLHGLHILHCDLKSQNLFLTAKDELQIGDFGISKTAENAIFLDKKTLGTPYYSSPEIFRESRFSPASDIWALGCVLYEMACLRVPFDADSLRSLVHRVTHGPIPVLCQVYSESLRQLHTDLMHRDYHARPSCVEIIRRPTIQDVIRRMLHGERCQPKDSPSPTADPAPFSSPLVADSGSKAPGDCDCPSSPSRSPLVLADEASQRSHNTGTAMQAPRLKEKIVGTPGSPVGRELHGSLANSCLNVSSSSSLRRTATTVLLSSGDSLQSPTHLSGSRQVSPASRCGFGRNRPLSRAFSASTLVVTGWSESGGSSGLSCASLQVS